MTTISRRGIRTVSSREERLSTQHFSEHTAHTPDVYGTGIFFEGQHNFRGAVPSNQVYQRNRL